jgi:hypothetical protein
MFKYDSAWSFGYLTLLQGWVWIEQKNCYLMQVSSRPSQNDIHCYHQTHFYKVCMEALKEESSTKWVAFVDSGEYIVPNRLAKI